MFYVQWHLTYRCALNCAHCYLGQKSRQEIPLAQALRILERMKREVYDEWELPLEIAFTGGDPLLHSNFFQILRRARELGIKTSILGTYATLNRRSLEGLREAGVSHFQLSLDGMSERHDFFRGKGGFKKTIQGIRALKAAGVTTHVMFTLSRLNAADLASVTQLCIDEGVDSFAWDHVVLVGNAAGKSELMFSPREFRQILAEYLELTTKLSGSATRLVRKNNLFSLLYLEEGMQEELGKLGFGRQDICGGCRAGWYGFAITPSSQVIACSRFPWNLGHLKNNNLYNIFSGRRAEMLRQMENYPACLHCELATICRGCPARSSRQTTFIDPLCWRVRKE